MTRCSTILALLCVMASSFLIDVRAQNTPQDFLIPHNAARKAVGVGPLVWNNSLASYAANYTNMMKEHCTLEENPDGPLGENLFWAPSEGYTAKDAVADWVSERTWYMVAFNSCHVTKVCHHYTQVVWKKSVWLGCAAVRCVSGAVLISCNYSPKGNIPDERPYPRPY